MEEKMKSGVIIYVCPFVDCEATFRKPWRFKVHQYKHAGLKPYPCENCDKSFRTRCKLTRHELTHCGKKPYKCLADGCSETSSKNSSMKNHMVRAHQHQEKQYQCDHQGCGKDFRKKNQLKAHKCEHQQLLLFHCSYDGCTREFSSHGQLKHHQKVHEGYSCDAEMCSFQGRTWTEYVKHQKEHKVKLPCEECKKLFNNNWFLHQHKLRVHSGVKPSFPCPREGCNKKFTRRFNLESHVLGDHEGQKPFNCPHDGCGKTFAMKESLLRHGVVHDPTRKKLKKVHLKKNLPRRKVQEVTIAAAATEEETDSLAAKLHNTNLQDGKS